MGLLVGGWTNPIEKYDRQTGNLHQKRGGNKKYFKPPPRFELRMVWRFFEGTPIPKNPEPSRNLWDWRWKHPKNRIIGEIPFLEYIWILIISPDHKAGCFCYFWEGTLGGGWLAVKKCQGGFTFHSLRIPKNCRTLSKKRGSQLILRGYLDVLLEVSKRLKSVGEKKPI